MSTTDGNVTVNGYETEDEPRMPKFRLTEQELRGLSAYLSASESQADRRLTRLIRASLLPGARSRIWPHQGEVRFRQMFCSTCHSLAVTRAGETKLIGGDIGPELTKVGSKVNPDWLVAWLRDPQGYLPHTRMPRYGWSDEDLYKVTQYIDDATDGLRPAHQRSQAWAAQPEQEIQLRPPTLRGKGLRELPRDRGTTPAKRFWPGP